MGKTTTQARPQTHEATVEDLYRYNGEGKAKLVNGVIVEMAATGEDRGCGYDGDEVFLSLSEHARQTHQCRVEATPREGVSESG